MPRKGSREKETSTPEVSAPSKSTSKSPDYSAVNSSAVESNKILSSKADSKLSEKKLLSSGVSGDEILSEYSLDSSESAASSISSASTGRGAAYDTPISPQSSSSSVFKDPKVYPNSIGDANLIASAQVLLQLAPHKYEVGDGTTYPNQLSHSSVPGITLSEIKSPSFLPLTQDKLLMLPGSMPRKLSIKSHLVGPSESMYFDRLLQATRSLDQLCESSGSKVGIADVFLLGFSIISKEPPLVIPESSRGQCTFLDNYLQGAPFSDFDIVTGYTLSAIGAINMESRSGEYEILAKELMNKAWTFLVEYLIARHTLVENQLEVLKALYFMAYTYLRYFKNDLIIGYLEETANAVFNRILNLQGSKELLKPYMDIIWNVYILVSKYKANSSPPKFYAWILSQSVDGSFSLSHCMLAFCKGQAPFRDTFFAEIVSCTFSNEVNNLIHKSSLAIYPNRVDLHAALSLSLNFLVDYSDATQVDVFKLYKGRLLSECPEHMRAYLKGHHGEVTKPWQWQILLLATKELDLGRKTRDLVREIQDTRFDEFGQSLINYLSEPTCKDLLSGSRGRLNEYLSNISTISYSLVLNSKLLHMGPFKAALDDTRVTEIESKVLGHLVFEWYLSMVKMFISILTSLTAAELDHVIMENPIFQGLLFVTGSYPLLPDTKASDVIFILYKNLTVVCDLWLDVHLSFGKDFRSNLSKVLNDLFLLASNNENFLINDVHISNSSIFFNGRPSKTTDFKESRSLSLTIPLVASDTDGSNLNGNYVLIKPKELLPPLKTDTSKLNASILPPLLAVPGLHLPQGSHNHRHSLLDLLSIAFLTVKNPPFVLPPLQHSIKTNLNDRPLFR